jgi:aminocarboxymuconate-semialdehyde decarboxylase
MTNDWSRYGPSAAREAGKAGSDIRAPGRTIDIHSHATVPAAIEYMRPYVDLSAIPLFHFASEDSKRVNANQERDRFSRMVEIDQRIAELDAMNIDTQVVLPNPAQCYYSVPPDIGATAARMVNDGLAEYASRRPDRFIPFGTVALQDGAGAAAELERCSRVLGFKGVEVLTNVAGQELSDPSIAEFWAKAEQLGSLVVIHPTGFTEARRLSRYYANNVIGNPLETTLALHNLIMDGVLERHPGLRILAVHGGGYLAAYSGRMDHAWGARSDCRAQLPLRPSEYLRRIYVDSIVFADHQIEYLARVFGADHLLMGTDYPYDMGEYDPVGHLASTALDHASISMIAGENAAALLKL